MGRMVAVLELAAEPADKGSATLRAEPHGKALLGSYQVVR